MTVSPMYSSVENPKRKPHKQILFAAQTVKSHNHSWCKWPELCGRGAISFTTTRPDFSTKNSTAKKPPIVQLLRQTESRSTFASVQGFYRNPCWAQSSDQEYGFGAHSPLPETPNIEPSLIACYQRRRPRTGNRQTPPKPKVHLVTDFPSCL